MNETGTSACSSLHADVVAGTHRVEPPDGSVSTITVNSGASLLESRAQPVSATRSRTELVVFTARVRATRQLGSIASIVCKLRSDLRASLSTAVAAGLDYLWIDLQASTIAWIWACVYVGPLAFSHDQSSAPILIADTKWNSLLSITSLS